MRWLRQPGTIWAWSGLLIALVASSGCNDESRNVGKGIRHHVVEPVTDQGLTLDQNADPKDVVYVLLRAIVDDYDAGDDAAAREAAFDRQLALCAPDYIFERAFHQSFGRDEAVQRIVWRWGPTLGHYRADFPKSVDEVRGRLLRATSDTVKDASGAEIERTRLFLELASPTGNVNANIVAQFQLVKEKGFWRVSQVGFASGIRHISVIAERLKSKGITPG